VENFRSDARVAQLPGLQQRAEFAIRRLFGHSIRERHRETVSPLEGRPALDSSDEVDEIVQERGLDSRAHDELSFVVQGTPRRDPLVGARHERDACQTPHPPKEPQPLRLRPLSLYATVATVFGY
jgi:hypothetical protein